MEETQKKKSWALNITSLFSSMFHNKRSFITAREAYNVATYNNNDLDHWIFRHQMIVDDLIRSKTKGTETGMSAFNDYYATYSLTDEDNKYRDEIFKPFVRGGFTVTPLADYVPSVIGSDNVYLISWRHPKEIVEES